LKELLYRLLLLTFTSQLPNDGKVKNDRSQICVNLVIKSHGAWPARGDGFRQSIDR